MISKSKAKKVVFQYVTSYLTELVDSEHDSIFFEENNEVCKEWSGFDNENEEERQIMIDTAKELVQKLLKNFKGWY
jgi:hypothetical protein